MFFAHVSLEIGRSKVGWFLLREQPVAANTVSGPAEDCVQLQGLWLTQAAGVVVAGGIKPGVQTGFDSPVIDVFLKPLFRCKFTAGTAGQQAERLGLTVLAFAPDAGSLPGKRMAGLLAVHFGADQSSYYRFSFFPACFLCALLGCGVKKRVAGSLTFASMYCRSCGWLSLTV